MTTSAFALPPSSPKAAPALIARDEVQFAAIAACLQQLSTELTDRLDTQRRAPGGIGRRAMDRDEEIRRLEARLRALRRFGVDLCLGRVVHADHADPVYIGRRGLTDTSGRRLLLDWRSPAAAPFFAATHANPMGLASRRRYRWTSGRVSDFWDEVFLADALAGHAALDDQSAFIASLGGARSERMRDVLATIQADQDAIIRAGSSGALVVDGGPGTGKTVVALHRTAYLLYADPRLRQRHGGVLFVGPHEPYLAYVSDVLPSLGEEDVQTCTLRDLVAEGAAAAPEADPRVAALKATANMMKAVDAAVRLYEEPPTTPLLIETEWSDVRLGAQEWAAAFDAVEPGTPHNEAREQIWAALLTILDDPSLARNRDLRAALHHAWPLLEPTDVIGDLWTVPAYLHRCAPWLSVEEVRALQRKDARAWTVADLPLLDAARLRLGEAARRPARSDADRLAERQHRARVIDDLLASTEHDDGEGLMPMLRQQDLQEVLLDDAERSGAGGDPLAGPFAHIVVDEAQELTDAEWQMLLLRCPSRSFTIVGDRAQARHGFTESWPDRLARVGFEQIGVAALTVNYRTPREVMAEAEPVIRAVLPDANVPTSIRAGGVPVRHGFTDQLEAVVDAWLAAHADGVACVIGESAFGPRPRVRSLTPELAKGLEFDLVVVVNPSSFGDGIEGAVDRYVAMTRATQELVILRDPPHR